ncbi:hypothetical protein JCM8097_009402 [Rhodosporidiobolus ruineniae]
MSPSPTSTSSSAPPPVDTTTSTPPSASTSLPSSSTAASPPAHPPATAPLPAVAPFRTLGAPARPAGAGGDWQRGLASGLSPKLSPRLGTSSGGFGVFDSGDDAVVRRPTSPNPNARASSGRSGNGQSHSQPPAGKSHLRRRSSSANVRETSLLLGADEPTSSGMERAASLTTFMSSGGKARGEKTDGARRTEKRRGSLHGGSTHPRLHRRRLYTSLTRLLGLVTLTLLALYVLKKAVFAIFSPSSPDEKNDTTAATGAPWLAGGLKGKGGSLLFDSLETVPYPIKTHPRTPTAAQSATLSFAEYLTTRLGSHFSFPSANIPGRTSRGSQLWLTTATNRSVGTSNRHLVAFARNLEATTQPLAQFQSDFFHSSNYTKGVAEAVLENRDQRGAQRSVVTICRDEGCMEVCRKDEARYCFGGFVGGEGENAEEVAKLRATTEALESGRRVFWADDGTYFRDDPVPYMGDLSSYDMQIPDTWSSGYINTGFSFINPTQRTISLFAKLLDVALLPSPADRLTWASTNLLLDPSGQQRNSHHTAPSHSQSDALDENLFDEDVEAPAEGKNEYGQIEFESPWDGGLDVRVLDPKRFRTSEGRLGRQVFDFEKKRGEGKLYWHCVCCGDTFTNDYIAGSLGFHQPTVSLNVPDITTVPSLPLLLRAPSLSGTPSELRYAMGLLLQLAHASGRTLIPPLTVTVKEENAGRLRTAERYIFRTFPIARWAHMNAPGTSTVALGSLPRDADKLKVAEPGFVQHAVAHLRSTFPSRLEATKLVKELNEPLFLDVRELISLKDMVHGLTRPFWSTERIVSLEGLEGVMLKPGWELETQFEEVAMCKRGEEREEKGTCTQLCPL